VTDAPILQAAKLWQKTSAKGSVYLVGRMGGVRVLVLRNRDAGAEGEPDWHLFFADGAPRTSEASPQPATTEPRHRSAYRGRRRSESAPPSDPRPFDDEIPF
jgi:hypothetical protein